MIGLGSGIPTGIPASVPLSVSMGPGPLQIPSSAPMAVPPSSLGDPQVVQVTQMIPTPCVVGDQPPPVSAEPPPPLMQVRFHPFIGFKLRLTVLIIIQLQRKNAKFKSMIYYVPVL